MASLYIIFEKFQVLTVISSVFILVLSSRIKHKPLKLFTRMFGLSFGNQVDFQIWGSFIKNSLLRKNVWDQLQTLRNFQTVRSTCAGVNTDNETTVCSGQFVPTGFQWCYLIVKGIILKRKLRFVAHNWGFRNPAGS